MQNVPSFYGKFPELGDFVNRRMPKDFLDPWDEWLQQAVATSRDQLDAEWLDRYLTSPLWRFALSGGLCGESPWLGVVMPSVDKVGRYFPLTMACRLPKDTNLIAAINLASQWFEMAETALISVLQDVTFDMEDFDAKIIALGGLDDPLNEYATDATFGFGSAWQIPLGGSDLSKSVWQLSHQLLKQRMGRYSLWWSAGSQNVEPNLLVSADMPLSTDYSAMLNGDWGAGSWEQWSDLSMQSDSLSLEPQF